MGEAIITRVGGSGASGDIALVPIPGYHSIGITLKTEDGRAISNCTLTCKDGSKTYNYTTNEKGQVIFTVNSGSANILMPNIIDGKIYRDILQTWKNVDAPIGGTSLLNIVHNTQSIYFTNKSEQFYIICDRRVDLSITGGGGGGGQGYSAYDDDRDYSGGGGGSGYLNEHNNINLNKGLHNFISGSGGTGGIGKILTYESCYNGNIFNATAGGTSTFDGLYSAIGGSAGTCGYPGRGGKGGLGNGGDYGDNGENSFVSWAGGGGGGGTIRYVGSTICAGGSPWGGNGGNTSSIDEKGVVAKSGTNSGGGGGAYPSSNYSGGGIYFNGGNGGSGTLRIKFLGLA